MTPGDSRPGTPPRPFTETIDARVADGARDAAELSARVDAVTRGGARAAVLGVNDGLVTNVCLILAIAGASSDAAAVRLAGFASLVAGAFSMAAGEWVSVRSQVELYRGILDELRGLIRRNPRLVLDTLTDRLVSLGFGRDTARLASTELPLDDQRFLAFTSRTVFGLDPDELGSPMTSAVSSFALFTVGALVPLVPWFVTDGTTAIVASVIATATASAVVGGWVSRSSGRPLAVGAGRQLAIVVIASGVTYLVGDLFGTFVT